MPRINIYVADDLHQRMRKHSSVNWSKVAHRAFASAVLKAETGRDWLFVASDARRSAS